MSTAKTHAKETKMRRAPDHQAEVLTVLPAGTEVEVLEVQPRFAKVHLRDAFQDQIGYIAAGFLEVESLPEPEPAAAKWQPCPRCCSREWGMFPVTHGGSSVMFISTGLFSGQSIKARVCLQCGYLEFCIDEEGMPDLRRWWEQQST